MIDANRRFAAAVLATSALFAACAKPAPPPIVAIKHEGVDLERSQFDRMLKVASDRLAARLLCTSLGIDAAEVKHRFGFAP